VLEEALILGGHESILDKTRNVAERYPDALAFGIAHRSEALSFAVEHHRLTEHYLFFELGVVGQSGQRIVVKRSEFPKVGV
jgi:hypothetical protein